jgi:hypothetical protein
MTALQALRNANPRLSDGFTQSVEAAREAVRVRIAGASCAAVNDSAGTRPARLRRLVPAAALGFSLTAAAAVAVLLMVGSPRGSGVEGAAAAVKKAVRLTTSAAEQSGTAVLQIRHDGDLWGEKTVRWNGDDVAIIDAAPGREGRVGAGLIVVDGTLYMPDPDGGWDELGSPKSIDPGSGTTPEEYLQAVREDVGGASLRRLTDGMSGMTTRQLADGSTVYSGAVAAGLVAREIGFKEGDPIRVLPFGYVAHGAAADPTARLDASLIVGPDDILREIAVSWGTASAGPAWTYTVKYGGLGDTPAPSPPAHPRPLLRERLRAAS